MTYSVKEIFYTLQGEGAQTGRPAVFCRFAGCNLWTGREQDRAGAICSFCDTDFVGTGGLNGGRFANARDLVDVIATVWGKPPDPGVKPLVVCTGGEPLLQLDSAALDAMHHRGFEIAIETNGTQPVPDGVDWICVSPKAGSRVVVKHGDELKLVFPQVGAEPTCYEHLDFDHFFLQPMDGPERPENTQRCIRYCLDHPRWRLSLQTHKLTGIP